MKTCKNCGESKPVALFKREKRNKDGRTGICRACNNTVNRAWRKKNPAAAAASAAKWHKGNRVKCRAYFTAWVKANPAKWNARVSQRRAAKIQATPGWANQGYIEDVYRKAAIFTKRDKLPWHVDHIVPLKSALVCGLHCEDNLQVIRGPENVAKSNQHWPHELFSIGGV